MSLRITDTLITCDRTVTFAEFDPDRAADGHGAWVLCNLPASLAALASRCLDRNAAITAMTLAEVLASAPPPGDRMWLFIDRWCAELHLPPLTPTAGPDREPPAASTADRDADGPHGPTATGHNPNRWDETRSARAPSQQSPTATEQGATSSAKTPVAPRHPAHGYAHEVHSS